MRLLSRKLNVISSLKDEIAECKQTIEAHKQRFRELAREYVMMGDDCLHETMDFTPAIANYNKAISISDDYIPAWYGKGLALMEAGEYEEAKIAFEKVVELDSMNYNAPFQLGNLYMLNDDLYEALNWYLFALNIKDKESAIHTKLADVYERIGDETQAENHRILSKKYRVPLRDKKRKK